MGIKTKLDAYPAEVLGGLRLGVSPLEMANAYATLASGGCASGRSRSTSVDVPRRPGREPRQAAQAPRVRGRRHPRGDEDPRAERQVAARARTLRHRLPGRRQDGHDGQEHRRLVRRLHAAPGDRRLGRPRQLARGDAGHHRRHDPGQDLGPVHEGRPRLLLRRVQPAEGPVPAAAVLRVLLDDGLGARDDAGLRHPAGRAGRAGRTRRRRRPRRRRHGDGGGPTSRTPTARSPAWPAASASARPVRLSAAAEPSVPIVPGVNDDDD